MHIPSLITFATRYPALLAFASSLALGADAPPAPLLLWPGKPPGFAENAGPEKTAREGHSIENVTVPSISVYLPPKDVNTGMAIIICPGGGYRALGWGNVVHATRYFLPRGIAIIGLKYRVGASNKITRDDRGIPLMDVKRAVRTVRHRAAEWGVDPRKIGVAGYSAGANLVITLVSQFDEGDPRAEDPIERQGSRPDFAVGCATWHWRQKESPFTFNKNAPPVFFVHATNDGLKGGAPIELPRAIKQQLDALGVPAKMDVYDQGAHGVGNLIPQWVEKGLPQSKWPEHLLEWLGNLDPRFKNKRGPEPAGGSDKTSGPRLEEKHQ